MLIDARGALTRFFSGYGYIVLVGILAIVGHIAALDAYTMSLMLLSAGIGVLISRSIRPFCAVLVMFIYQCSVEHSPSMPSFSDYYYTEWRAVILVSHFAIFAIALLIYYIRDRRVSVARIRSLPYKRASLLLATALLLSGVLSGRWVWESLIFAAAQVLSLVLLPYLLMLGASDSDGEGAVDYLIGIAEVVATVLIIETAHLYLTGGVVVDGVADKGRVLYGWGIWTTAGMDMAVLIPLLFLGVMRKTRSLFRFMLANLLYLCCALTLSRNALIFGTLALALSATAAMLYAPMRCLIRRIYAVCGVLVALTLPLWISGALRLLSDFLLRGLSDNGRFALWGYGIDCFLESPLFGNGFFALVTDTFRAENIFPPMLHNTFIQLAAATGIFGVVAYIIWQSAVLTRLILPFSAERALLALSLVTLLLMSMLDNFIFHVQPMFLFAILIAAGENADKTMSTAMNSA